MSEETILANDDEGELQPKKLTEVLTERTAVLGADQNVVEAGNKLRALDTDCLPVREGDRLVGVVTERHPDRTAGGQGHDPKTERVAEFMSRDLIFCYEDQDRKDALQLMTERQLKYLPIVNRDLRIVGIVTKEDLDH